MALVGVMIAAIGVSLADFGHANAQESWRYRIPTIRGGVISQLGSYDAESPYYCAGHTGLGSYMDITVAGGNTDEGVPLYAVGDGTIDHINTTWTSGVGLGKYVDLTSYGVTFRYGHLAKIYVSQGQSVQQGDLIGLLGDTGDSTTAHLHWDAWLEGTSTGYDGIFDIQNVEEFSTSSNPCVYPGTIRLEFAGFQLQNCRYVESQHRLL